MTTAHTNEQPQGTLSLEQTKENTNRKTNTLNGLVMGSETERAARLGNNPQEMEAAVTNALGPRMLLQLSGIIESNKSIVDRGLRTQLNIITKNDPIKFQKTIDDILSALTDDVYGNLKKHRYLYRDNIPKKNESQDTATYGILFGKCEEDYDFLQELIAMHPDKSEELRQLQSMINRFVQVDPRNLGMYQVARSRNSGYGTQGLKQMGKMSLFLAGTGLAVITGIMSISQKKFSAAPFLYAAVAGLVASPSLRRLLFSPQQEIQLHEINTVLNDRQFLIASQTYNIQGARWRALADQLMNSRNNKTLKQFVESLRKDTATDTEKETFVKNMTLDAAEQEQLKNMINQKKFVYFADQLMSVGTKDAKSVIGDYIERGAAKYAKEIRSVEDVLEESQQNQRNT